jgi:hypothetical protein
MATGTTAMVRGNEGTTIAREGLTGREIEQRSETASSAVVAQAQAEIQARYAYAKLNPRDDDHVRSRLLRECQRSRFAERAFYSLPRGDKPGRITGARNRIEGLSVRFAEAAIRLSGNIAQQSTTKYDDDVKRIVTVLCIDLETNAIYSKDLIIEKTIERKAPKDKAVIIGQRTNSAGDVVYIVKCTDDELLQKESALISKTFRTLALRLVPADTLEDCESQIYATSAAEIASDPEAARKKLADAFASLNVFPADLTQYLGHELATCSPAEMQELRGLYAAIRDGEATWAEVMAEKAAPAQEDGKAAQGGKKSVAARVAEKVKAHAASAAKGAPAKPAEPPRVAEADAPPPDEVKTVGHQREPGEEG